MPVSDAKRKAIAKYDAAHMTTFSVKINNNLHDLLQCAVNDLQTNRNAYVTNAIKQALEKDGYIQSEQK